MEVAYDVQAERIPDDAGAEKTKETVRTYFPETWIWELVSLG